MSNRIHCLGALALELSASGDAPRSTLERAEAEELAALLARDLGQLLPGAERLDGAFAAALYDPAELLRPGWPVHSALTELAELAPGARGGRVIAVGAHQGQMPSAALQPDPQFQGGLLRLLPFALIGEPERALEVGRLMEERLLDTGMAGAGTALQAQSGFGATLEHARYLSIHDLCALIAHQYQHAGLADIWRLIEAALLSPDSAEWLDSDDGLIAVGRGHQVRIADPSPSIWRHRFGRLHADVDGAWQRYQIGLRQLMAILAAHGIGVEKVPLGIDEDPRQLLH
ncbi:hypothetical protein [Pseudomarimonas arenosa]|uniref:Uncharacterized protein n=1 Tax=Pseudomarimonas arenosa TaxID=2774145 RepID=A0AAW3ZPD2_9GAMM|nr:hypothetical protein [Pseudomarimonas arenosa]MBD8527971.1 hypothetical protein [Pseudomarimonas arenosa]